MDKQEMIDRLTSIEEYWNRSENDRAMSDALYHILNEVTEIKAALQSIRIVDKDVVVLTVEDVRHLLKHTIYGNSCFDCKKVDKNIMTQLAAIEAGKENKNGQN